MLPSAPKLPGLCSLPLPFLSSKKALPLPEFCCFMQAHFPPPLTARCLSSSAPVTKISSPRCVIFSREPATRGLKAAHARRRRNDPESPLNFQVAASCQPPGQHVEALLPFAAPPFLPCSSLAGLAPRWSKEQLCICREKAPWSSPVYK